MSTMQMTEHSATDTTSESLVDFKLEVVVVPVADVQRSADFYAGRLGWRVDADNSAGDFRALQVTPPGSNASIIFGQGVTDDEPGSIGSLLLAVEDIEVARDELIARGVEVGEIFHHAGGSLGGGFIADVSSRATGLDPERRSYASYARFRDPDGNGWLLQEIAGRLPGRVTGAAYEDAEDLAEALRRVHEAHTAHEIRTGEPDADWPGWYAKFLVAEQTGEDLPL